MQINQKECTMSMMSTMSKIAIGVMVVRGIGKAMGGSGSITDMLGSMLGGGKNSAESSSGGNILGSILGSLTGGKSGGGSDLGSLLTSALQGKDVKAAPTEEEKAQLLLKAIISAAKADGVIDAEEEAQIKKYIGDVTPEELAIVKEELASPVDIEGLVEKVPEEMAQQVYAISALAINIDTDAEVNYLDQLARELGITPETVNAIHEKLNKPALYEG